LNKFFVLVWILYNSNFDRKHDCYFHSLPFGYSFLPIGILVPRFRNYIFVLIPTIGRNQALKGGPASMKGETATGAGFCCIMIYTSDYL
jgi:hypothetical protein